LASLLGWPQSMNDQLKRFLKHPHYLSIVQFRPLLPDTRFNLYAERMKIQICFAHGFTPA
jgi:hypothetical protein